MSHKLLSSSKNIILKSMAAGFAIMLALTGCAPALDAGKENISNVSEALQKETKPLEISIIAFPQSGFSPVNGTDTQKLLEEKFNVRFNVLDVDSSTAEKFNLFWAQGGKADVMIAFTDVKKLIDQGLFREVDEKLLYEKMPTWLDKMDTLIGDSELVKKTMKYNGKNYCIPFTHGPVIESGLMIARKDWMEKVGISKAPETLDEFEAMLKAFTESDPDENGKNDTYGIHGGQRYHFNYVWGASGIMPKTFVAQNDKVNYTSVMQETKDVLKRLNSWYEAGYIDPEFVTDDRTIQRNKWSEGKLGVLSDNAFWIDSARGANGVLAMVEAKNSKATFELLKPFKGPDGKQGSAVDFPSTTTGQGAIYFDAKASDDVVIKMMEIKEALASDWELYKRCYYGVKDTHYTEDSNGKIKILPSVDAEVITKSGIGQTYSLMPITIDWMSKTMNERDELAHSQSMEQPTVYSGIAFPVSRTNDAARIKGEDVFKLVDEYYNNAVTGKIDIDATWDDYVKRVNDAGLTEIVEEYQQTYNESK